MRKTNNGVMRHLALISIILSLIIIPSTVDAFSDVNQNDWFYENVASLRTRGVIDGYTDNTFKPEANVSHGESLKLLVMLNRSQVPDDTLELPVSTQNPIKYQKHWAERYVQAAVNDEILHLDNNGLDYNKEATRIETATYILNYINTATNSKIAPLNIIIGSITESSFADAYGDGLNFLYESGIIKGTPATHGKNNFQGERNVTRAEFTAMMDRAESFVLGDSTEIKPVDPYSMINNVRTISYSSIDEHIHNTFDIKDYIRAIYYMKYHNLESIKFSYSSKYYDDIIMDGKMRKDYIDEIRAAYRYVSGSYPELFFSEHILHFSGKKDSSGAVTVTVGVRSPTFTRQDIVKRRQIFEEETMKVAKKMIDEGKIKDGMTELEIAKELHAWVVDTVEYDYSEGAESFDGYSALINKKAVCNGYSALLHRMMSLFGIEVVGTTGMANGVLHIWGEAMLDGQKYYIDPTWNDGYKSMKYFTTDVDIFSDNGKRTWDKVFFDSHRDMGTGTLSHFH